MIYAMERRDAESPAQVTQSSFSMQRRKLSPDLSGEGYTRQVKKHRNNASVTGMRQPKDMSY